LVEGHGGADRHVRGAVGNPALPQARVRVQGRAHPDVDHLHVGTDPAREGVDHRAAGQEVRHHLGGHLLGPRRHALGVHPVVAGEHRDGGRLGERWRARPRDPGEGHGEVLDAAERATRFGHAVQPVPGGRLGLLAGGTDGGHGVGDQVGHRPSRPRAAAGVNATHATAGLALRAGLTCPANRDSRETPPARVCDASQGGVSG
jgi:hypothetical protein